MNVSFSMRSGAGFASLALFAVYLISIAGCEIPAQVVWSPDGTRAAYRAGDSAMLISAQGQVVQRLGSSVGGFVWSADSNLLYLAARDENRNEDRNPTTIDQTWIGPTNDPATQPTTTPDNPKTVEVISVLDHGQSKPLFRLADVAVWHLQLSPDGQWLAAITSVRTDDDNSQEFRLFVYSIRRDHLYELSRFCGIGACFTGPATLDFVEASGTDAVGQLIGHLVRVNLQEPASSMPRRNLLDVVVPLIRWIEPCDGGLIFTAAPCSFPARPTSDWPMQRFKLFHYVRADGGLTVLADDVGELFAASPDGKHILFERRTPPELPATMPATTQAATEQAAASPSLLHDDLCVMNANGSDPHVLRSLSEYVGSPQPPMWPAWRGNDQITFIAPADQSKPSGDGRLTLDVVEYQLTAKGTLDRLQLLSGKWDQKDKPYFRADSSR